MEQKQSYLSTVVKGDMNLYEVRIFMLIVEQAQAVIEGEKLKDIIGKAFSSDHLNINFSVQMKRLVANRHHYDVVLDACEKLSKRFVKIRDEQGKRRLMTPFLYNIILEEGSGILRFSVAHWLVDYILDFTRGVCRYDLQVARQASLLCRFHSSKLSWAWRKSTSRQQCFCDAVLTLQ